jgi:hypothetical protein
MASVNSARGSDKLVGDEDFLDLVTKNVLQSIGEVVTSSALYYHSPNRLKDPALSRNMDIQSFRTFMYTSEGK